MPQIQNTQTIDLTQHCVPVQGGKLAVKSWPSWVMLSNQEFAGTTIQITKVEQNTTQITRSGNIVVEQRDANNNPINTITVKIMQDGMSYTYEYVVTSVRLSSEISGGTIEPNQNTVTLVWELEKRQKFDNGTTVTVSTTTMYGGADVGTNSNSASTRTINGINIDMGDYEVTYSGTVTQKKNYKINGEPTYELITTSGPLQPKSESVSYRLDLFTPFIWAVENPSYASGSTVNVLNGSFNVKEYYEEMEMDWDAFVDERYQQYEDTQYEYTVEYDNTQMTTTYTISSYVRECNVTYIVKNPVSGTKITIEPYVVGGSSVSAVTYNTSSYGPETVVLTGNKNYDYDGDEINDSFSGTTEFVVRWYDLYETADNPNSNSIIGAAKAYKNGTLVGDMVSGENITFVIE